MRRYRLRSDEDGWTVYDVWTGQPVRLSGAPQRGLPRQVAEVTARLLNLNVREGDRQVLL